jgi:hypothetical protein
MRSTPLIIHDVTDLRRHEGVAFEIGLSIGLKKPFLLIWDVSRRIKVSHSELPEVIRSEHVQALQLTRGPSETLKSYLRDTLAYPETGALERFGELRPAHHQTEQPPAQPYSILFPFQLANPARAAAHKALLDRGLRVVDPLAEARSRPGESPVVGMASVIRKAAFAIMIKTCVGQETRPITCNLVAGTVFATDVPGLLIDEGGQGAASMWNGSRIATESSPDPGRLELAVSQHLARMLPVGVPNP